MNIDTDMQWAYWEGIKTITKPKSLFARSDWQPEGDDKPNKKQYDPRVWLREGKKVL